MNANELADILQQSDFLAMDFAEDAATMLRQLQAENEAVKESNKNLMELVTMLREELDKARQEVLMWENAEVPPETMADIIEELERRGFITK